MNIDHIFYIAYFMLGLSISELMHAIFDRGYLKRIAIASERFADDFNKEVKK